MPDIKLQRKHQLGLPKARKLAWAWAEQVEQEFGMECTVLEGEDGDTVEFTRPGVRGTLDVSADRFDLQARLGLLVGAFSKSIEAEIERRLDDLIAAMPGAKVATKTAAKTTAKPNAKTAKSKRG